MSAVEVVLHKACGQPVCLYPVPTSNGGGPEYKIRCNECGVFVLDKDTSAGAGAKITVGVGGGRLYNEKQ